MTHGCDRFHRTGQHGLSHGMPIEGSRPRGALLRRERGLHGARARRGAAAARIGRRSRCRRGSRDHDAAQRAPRAGCARGAGAAVRAWCTGHRLLDDRCRVLRRLPRDACGAKGLVTLDAPVSGGVGGAAAGTLTFMVGGTEAAYRACPRTPARDGQEHHSRRRGRRRTGREDLQQHAGRHFDAGGVRGACTWPSAWASNPEVLRDCFDVVGPVLGAHELCTRARPGAVCTVQSRLRGRLRVRTDAEGLASGRAGRRSRAARLRFSARPPRSVYAMHCAAGRGRLDFSSIIQMLGAAQPALPERADKETSMKTIRRTFNSGIIALLFTGTRGVRAKGHRQADRRLSARAVRRCRGAVLADRLGPAIGRTLIVENMPGQSGSVALAAVSRMPADGSVMTLSASAAIAGNPFLYRNVRYDSVKDFEPIGLIYDAPLVLLVNSTLADPVAEGADRVREGEPGQGELLVARQWIRIASRHVGAHAAHRHRDDARALSRRSQVAHRPGRRPGAGLVRRLRRCPALPGGWQGARDRSEFDASACPCCPRCRPWRRAAWTISISCRGSACWHLPARRRPSSTRSSEELARIVRSPDFSQRIVGLGGRPRPSSAAEFKSFVRSEVDRWAAVDQRLRGQAGMMR